MNRFINIKILKNKTIWRVRVFYFYYLRDFLVPIHKYRITLVYHFYIWLFVIVKFIAVININIKNHNLNILNGVESTIDFTIDCYPILEKYGNMNMKYI